MKILSNMKKTILTLLLLPMMAWAQDDAKYLAGAVPVVDGKVVFSNTLAVDGQDQASIYKKMLTWAEELVNRKGTIDKHTRVVYKNEDTGEIAVSGEEYIVFSEGALSIDRTRIYYTLGINCKDNQCNLQLYRIKYLYDENRNGGVKYTAEEILPDEVGLNKDKTKLAKMIGKFRKGTIDVKDDLFQGATRAFGETTITAAHSVTEEPKVKEAEPEKVTTSPVVKVPAEKKIEPELVKTEPATITNTNVVKEEKKEEKTAVPVVKAKQEATFTLEKGTQAYDLLEKSDSVKLTIISPNGNVTVIDFKKTNAKMHTDGKSCTFTGEVSNQNVN